jgi:hypothetical protein
MKTRLWQCRQNLPPSGANSNWLPTSRRQQGPKMTTGKEARSKVEETARNRRTRRTMLTRRNRREMRTRRRHLPRKEKLTRRRSRDVHTWHWCKHHMAWGNNKEELRQLGNERTNQQPAASTKLQPKPPWQPTSTPSGKPSWPTWPATWPTTDWPDPHGNHGQRSG